MKISEYRNINKLISISIIVGFSIGFVKTILFITENQYLKHKLFKLILFYFQKSLNKWILTCIIISALLSIIYTLACLLKKIFKININKYYKESLILAIHIIIFIALGWIVNRYLSPYQSISLKSLAVNVGFLLFMFLLYFVLKKISTIKRFKKIINKVFYAITILFIFTTLFANVYKFVFSEVFTPNGTNIILIVMDTVKQSHLSCYGYKRNTSPNIDKIAERGILFENTYAVAPWTPPSHASIFTGLYSCQHGTHQENRIMDNNLLTIAEILLNKGYQTIGFSNNAHISSITGFHQGFQAFYDLWRTKYKMLCIKNNITNDAGACLTVKEIKKWIDNHPNSKRPFFIFVNFMEAHSPYSPPENYKWLYVPMDVKISRYMTQYDYIDYLAGKYKMSKDDFEISKALYDAEITYLDNKIGELVRYLEDKNILNNTVLIITSDHGEEFGEHGLVGHQFSLYNILLRVPLIIWVPSQIETQHHRTGFVQLIDIFNTILEFAKIDPPESVCVQGKSLIQEQNRDYIFAEYYRPENYIKEFRYKYPDFNPSKFNHRIRSVQSGEFKFIWSSQGRHEFYNIYNDPGENHNIINEYPQKADKIKDIFFRIFDNINDNNTLNLKTKKKINSKELLDELRSLGYIN